MNISDVLTPEQRRRGLSLASSEDMVVMMHSGHMVGRYSSHVTVETLRQDAQNHLEQEKAVSCGK